VSRPPDRAHRLLGTAEQWLVEDEPDLDTMVGRVEAVYEAVLAARGRM